MIELGSTGLGYVPRLVGADLQVPLVTGRTVPYANLDYAASTPSLVAVRRAVDRLLPWYSSVHRGAGYASEVCTQAYEQARNTVRRFTGAPSDATVLFTRNTTDALNLLGRALPSGTTVFRFASDHHAALLAWRGAQVIRLETPPSATDAVADLTLALERARPGPRLVVITAVSNVTGEHWPVAELAAAARDHGARTVLDAAQVAAHEPLEVARWGVDWVAMSGHKMYAPFGAGALVGVVDWLAAAEPYLAGGGATALVAEDAGAERVIWSELPHRHEGGSPNVVGAHAMATACDTLSATGWTAIRDHERPLASQLCGGLDAIPGVHRLALWGPEHPHGGVASFIVTNRAGEPLDPRLVATVLAVEHGIGVRDGAFCAHQAVHTMLCRLGHPNLDGALRASIGLGTTTEHVDRLLAALEDITRFGPRWSYARRPAGWAPVPDPRPAPDFLR
jgi:selenocysteine lyase/cysteine desulfurase